MYRGSSRVLSRMGSYFGVENTETEESSLDLWNKKIARAAKRETFDVSLANLLPTTAQDPDEDIKILEDALANVDNLASDEMHSSSSQLMGHSQERIIAVQALGGSDVGAGPSHEKIIAVEELQEGDVHFLGDGGEHYELPERNRERTNSDGSEAAGVAPRTTSISMGRHLTSAEGGEQRPSVSFCPTVSVVEFEQGKEYEEARLKGLLGSLLKLRTHRNAEVDAEDQQDLSQSDVKYQTILSSSSPTSDIVEQDDTAKRIIVQDERRLNELDEKHKEWLSDSGLSVDNERDVLHGSQAILYYESMSEAKRLPGTHEQRMVLENLRKKEELLDAVMESAKESENVSSETRSRFWGIPLLWRTPNVIQLHPTLSSQIRVQIEGLPDYKPYVTLVLTLTQLIVFSLLWYFGGMAHIGLRPTKIYLDDVKTFRGTETMVGVRYPNVWIGPTAAFWIRSGALFAPCLRSDFKINVMLSKQDYHITDELGCCKELRRSGALFAPCLRSDYKINVMLSKQDYHITDQLGCCEVQERNTAGTTTRHECQDWTYGVGLWQATECGKRATGANNIQHILKPCCYKLTGECKLTTHQHCTFLGGYYHSQGAEHCSKVNCLSDVCGQKGANMEADEAHPFMPVKPNQWWRYIFSPFFHNGLLHLILVLIPQLVLAVPLERMAGGVRFFLIYIISDVIGNLFASLFTPYLPHMGGSAAICGLIAVQSIELAQSWVLVEHPHRTIFKLLIILIIFIISGTLPYLDNFAHIGGFATGLLTGLIFLPYIVFGEWHFRRRRMILFLAVPMLCCLFCLLLLMYYKIQDVDNCAVCNAINCIPYTPYLCNTTWYNPQPKGS